MSAGSLRYTPGSAVAVVHQQAAVLLDLDSDDPIVTRVYALLEAGGGVDDVLDVLVSSGLKSLADFGAFQVTDAGVRLVVRGKITGTVGELAGLNAEHTMWHDTWQPEVSTAALERRGTIAGPALIIKSGVVLAGGIVYGDMDAPSVDGDAQPVDGDAHSVAAPPPNVGDIAATERETVASVSAQPEASTVPGAPKRAAVPAAASTLGADSIPGADSTLAADQANTDQSNPEQASTDQKSTDQKSTEQLPPDQPVPGQSVPGLAVPGQTVQEHAASDQGPAGATPADPAAEREAETDSEDFAHLFGLTQQPPPVEPEAAPAADVAAESTPADPGATMDAPLTISAAELPTAVPAEPAPAQLITGMPWASEASVPGSPVLAPSLPSATPEPVWTELHQPASADPAPKFAEPGAPGEFAGEPAAEPTSGRTVNRAALIGLPPVVMVVAARCPVGHLSPAYAGTCRVCAAPVPQQQPVEMPRPTLGQLRLSTGGVVPLDRPLILGRNPRIPAGYASEQPNLVRLPDPNKDVSGQHLEVSLDYWNVVVRDLGSTNGTEVVLPGELPVVLRANDPVIIEPGTRVVLASTISFVFEVLP
jgi:hypothetical protein